MEEIERYMKRYEDSLGKLLNSLEATVARHMLQHLDKAHDSIFGKLQKRIDEVDSTVKDQWPGRMAQQPIPIQGDLVITQADIEGAIQEQRISYSPTSAFDLVQQKVLGTWSNSPDLHGRITHLRFASRSFLAIASCIPYILTLPYWLRKSYIASYRLSLDALRKSLLRVAKAHSTEFLDQLQEELIVQRQLETDLATSAIASSFSKPEGYVVSDALPELKPREIQATIAANANILAIGAVTGYIVDLIPPKKQQRQQF